MECFLWVHIWAIFLHLSLLLRMPHGHCIWHLDPIVHAKSERGWIVKYLYFFNTLEQRKNCHHVADSIFRCIFLNENVWISLKISLKFVPKGPINNIPALVQVMAWCWLDDKPLSEPIMVRLPTHICITRPQWVTVVGQSFSNLVEIWLNWLHILCIYLSHLMSCLSDSSLQHQISCQQAWQQRGLLFKKLLRKLNCHNCIKNRIWIVDGWGEESVAGACNLDNLLKRYPIHLWWMKAKSWGSEIFKLNVIPLSDEPAVVYTMALFDKVTSHHTNWWWPILPTYVYTMRLAVLIICRVNRHFILHEEGLQRSLPVQWWEIMENGNNIHFLK